MVGEIWECQATGSCSNLGERHWKGPEEQVKLLSLQSEKTEKKSMNTYLLNISNK